MKGTIRTFLMEFVVFWTFIILVIKALIVLFAIANRL